MSKELIRLVNCQMAFDEEIVLDDINLYFNDKEFLTLLGPSGCGKTTTLRIIGGFLKPTSGDVFFDGERINDVPPHKRKVNTVFQKYALFPHLDVYENVAFGLRIAKLPEDEIDERVTEMLEIVRLKGFENRKVSQLSGGQQQRVAIARALVTKAPVILADEPTATFELTKIVANGYVGALFEDYFESSEVIEWETMEYEGEDYLVIYIPEVVVEQFKDMYEDDSYYGFFALDFYGVSTICGVEGNETYMASTYVLNPDVYGEDE